MRLSEKKTAPLRLVLSAIALSCGVLSAHAQGHTDAAPGGAASLKEVFETAWQRQPEARALQSRRDAAQAQAKAAGLLSPEAPSLEISQRSDRTTEHGPLRIGDFTQAPFGERKSSEMDRAGFMEADQPRSQQCQSHAH